VIPTDPRVWVPQATNVWFRPLMLNRTSGGWLNLLKVTRAGVLSRHVHPAPVHGLVLEGSWRYLEHDWVARKGMYVFEPPGEIHTLTVDDDCPEMQTVFVICGPVLYIDDHDQVVHVEDNIGLIELCRHSYEESGLGADYVDQFIR
jgi:quercetin dioxygenase-like cupin family protein